MKKVFTVLLLFVVPNLQAQTDDFNTFRNRMLSDYKDYRKGMMERYEEFLDAVWKEYETMTGQRRETRPKPTVAPVYMPPTEPVAPVSVTPKEPEPVNVPVVPDISDVPKSPVVPKVPSVPSPNTPQIHFVLYGLQLAVPSPRLDATLHSATQRDVVAFWKQINESEMRKCVEALQQNAINYRLGDWCTFKAVEAYCKKWAKGNSHAERVMMQYIMLSMGYDVRIAVADNEVYLMLPFEQQVYGNPYLTVNDTRYYLYPNGLSGGSGIYTCSIPAGTDCGKRLDLIINPAYLLPKDNHAFSVSYGSLSASGSVNKNVISLQQEYPSMDIYCYAASIADEEVRRSVVSQLKSQVEGMSEAEAANALLHFVQSAFKYKTDGQQFGDGVEKSFFFDETLYFPYCDCEDRSIFYAYLVKEILGIDVLLVSYPGHECTAVALSEAPASNTRFTYKGKAFYICDPTYIGADIGVCMPDYVEIQPEIEEWY